MKILALSILLCLGGGSLFAQTNDKRVLIIGIDGTRPDALAKAVTPHLDELIRRGAFTDTALILGDRYRENNTISGPSWSSILTGVWADKHRVNDNLFRVRNYKEFPHFFERVKAARPEAFTVSMVSWQPIDQFIVSAADIRHVEPLPGGVSRTLDLTVSAGSADTRDGQWHHLAGIRRGKMVSLFLNGKPAGSAEDTTGDFELDGDFFHIGRDTRTGPTQFKGELGGVRLWDRALNPAELEALVQQGSSQARLPEAVRPEKLLSSQRPASSDIRLPLDAPLRNITSGDFTVEAWFKTTDPGRGVLLGNYRSNQNSLNLELQTDNRVRLYLQPHVPPEVRLARENEMDRNMAAAAARVLRETDPTAMFVYFHQVDATGHALGFSPERAEYVKAIQNVDGHIGTVLAALRSRPGYSKEDWLIIVCTDHGGLGTRHSAGHNDPEILTVFLIVSGPSALQGRIAGQAYLVDVVPTALTHLGIPISSEWKLDGRAVGLRR